MRKTLFAFGVFVSSATFADTAKVAAYVVDSSNGEPISSAVVRANFAQKVGGWAWVESPHPDVDKQMSGLDGHCSLKGETNCGRVSCWVTKAPVGYYAGGGWGHTYTNKDFFGVWQPDNLVATIRLDRVEHPIPLWVKGVCVSKAHRQAPVFNGTNAVWRYDLMMGDWLPPLGNGEEADLVIKIAYRIIEEVQGVSSRFDCYECIQTVTFPGVGNGEIASIAGSARGIRLRQAPETGFVPSFETRFGTGKKVRKYYCARDEYDDSNPKRCHAFRIRSKYDDRGNLVEAYYGKIYGDFNFKEVWHGVSSPLFRYYLNRTSLDRNLEWDMKTNLCPEPGSLSQPQP